MVAVYEVDLIISAANIIFVTISSRLFISVMSLGDKVLLFILSCNDFVLLIILLSVCDYISYILYFILLSLSLDISILLVGYVVSAIILFRNDRRSMSIYSP